MILIPKSQMTESNTLLSIVVHLNILKSITQKNLTPRCLSKFKEHLTELCFLELITCVNIMPSHAKDVFKVGDNKVYMQIRENPPLPLPLHESRTYRHYRFKIKKL